MKHSFPPVFDNKTEILILGSMPGEESLRQQRYYAHPRNQFWKILGDIIGEDLREMEYKDRLEALKRHKIGLWDVYQSCERKGSLDTNIKNAELNDFSILPKTIKKCSSTERKLTLMQMMHR